MTIEPAPKITPIAVVDAWSSWAKNTAKNGAVIPSASPAPPSVNASMLIVPWLSRLRHHRLMSIGCHRSSIR
ncbi:MAG: hypothetical protein DMD80_19875 [Candidatus Rokuibacteriota bacterium]|nr:MAG: hypothetical protein DMD80_19875 [Candidatus Rokubacteria bacterium]